LEYGDHFFHPTVRLGVTGLSRAGKTVFITALGSRLTRGGSLPRFSNLSPTGRIARARLEPQPDDAVPRFDYENHVRTLIEERRWPNSTVDYQRAAARYRLPARERRGSHAHARYRRLPRRMAARSAGLLNKSYRQWFQREPWPVAERPRARLAAQWHAHLATLNAGSPRRRAGGADGRAAVHGLSARLSRRTLRHEPCCHPDAF
jgi:predicted YcjX-like family ATPase